jgi:hypothetical protein
MSRSAKLQQHGALEGVMHCNANHNRSPFHFPSPPQTSMQMKKVQFNVSTHSICSTGNSSSSVWMVPASPPGPSCRMWVLGSTGGSCMRDVMRACDRHACACMSCGPHLDQWAADEKTQVPGQLSSWYTRVNMYKGAESDRELTGMLSSRSGRARHRARKRATRLPWLL